MDPNEFYKFEIDNLVNELTTQIESNRQIYERVKQDDFDKRIEGKLNSVRDNISQQIKTHNQYLSGIESGTLNFGLVENDETAGVVKDQLLLKLVQQDKKIFSVLRSVDILDRLFTVPWKTEQVRIHDVIRSMLLHEAYFMGRNSVLIEFLELNTMKTAESGWNSNVSAPQTKPEDTTVPAVSPTPTTSSTAEPTMERVTETVQTTAAQDAMPSEASSTPQSDSFASTGDAVQAAMATFTPETDEETLTQDQSVPQQPA